MFTSKPTPTPTDPRFCVGSYIELGGELYCVVCREETATPIDAWLHVINCRTERGHRLSRKESSAARLIRPAVLPEP